VIFAEKPVAALEWALALVHCRDEHGSGLEAILAGFQHWVGLRKFLFKCNFSKHIKMLSFDPLL